MPCASPCGESVQVLGTWTSNHDRQVDIPVVLLTVLLNGLGCCLQTHQNTLVAPHLELSKDKLFSPTRMSESQTRFLEDHQSLCSVQAPRHTSVYSPFHLSFYRFYCLVEGEIVFLFCQPSFFPRDPVDLD